MRRAAAVDHDDISQAADAQVLPHKIEARLARRAEEVQHDLVRDRDRAEVERRGGLPLERPLRRMGDLVLGRDGLNIADGLNKVGLAGGVGAGDHEFDGLLHVAP